MALSMSTQSCKLNERIRPYSGLLSKMLDYKLSKQDWFDSVWFWDCETKSFILCSSKVVNCESEKEILQECLIIYLIFLEEVFKLCQSNLLISYLVFFN